jgi:signal recognition particle subunit SRP54
MLPGMGQMKDQLAQVDDRDLDRIMAIIRSMTPEERQSPGILQASRKARVARGSGVTVTEVNQLLDRFSEAQKMMRQMARGGIPGIPGMRRASKKAAKKAGKRAGGKARSGNPAARAAQLEAQAQARASRPGKAPVNPFGLPGGDGVGMPAAADLGEMMPDLSKLRLPPGPPPARGKG